MLDRENTVDSLKNNKIQDYKLLSDSFNINCYKLLIDEKLYVVKFFKDKKFFSNAILAEKNNLEFLRSLNLDIFPESNPKYFFVEYISIYLINFSLSM